MHMDVNEKVKYHMQKINEAMDNDNREKMRRHYGAIIDLYDLDEE